MRDLCLTVTEGHHNHKIKREGSHVGGHMSDDSLTMDVGGGEIDSIKFDPVCLPPQIYDLWFYSGLARTASPNF